MDDAFFTSGSPEAIGRSQGKYSAARGEEKGGGKAPFGVYEYGAAVKKKGLSMPCYARN